MQTKYHKHYIYVLFSERESTFQVRDYTDIITVCSFPLHIGHSGGPVITLGMESTNLVISQKVGMTQKT